MQEQGWLDLIAPLQAFVTEATVASLGFWAFLADHPADAVKAFGGLVALSAFASNWRALREVRESIVTCASELNFTGLRIGPSGPYVVPLRQLFFAYSAFVFYQIVSQVTGVWRVATVSDVGVEFFLHGVLFLAVYRSWRSIIHIAKETYTDDVRKLKRFSKELDDALADKRISITNLLHSTLIFPIAALAPKIFQTLS